MAVKCGKCKGHHETSAEVRECYFAGPLDTIREDGTISRGFANPDGISATMARYQMDADAEPTDKWILPKAPAKRSSTDRVYLSVPYAEKDQAKKLGAMWDAEKRRWFVWGGASMEDFARWMGGGEATGDAEGRPKASPTPMVTEDGMYRTADGVIWKVQEAVHGSGRLYAKQLVFEEGDTKGRFVYIQGGIYKLRAEERMSMEEAAEFGKLYGFCCVCGRTLTNEDSIEAGIGPICAERF